MEVKTSNANLLQWTGDGLAIGFFEGKLELIGDLANLNDKLAGAIQELITEEEFKAKINSIIFTRVIGGSQVRKIIVVGLGKAEDFNLESLRIAAASIVRVGKKQNVNL
ncbi:Cytosol aminopeptidase PepA [Richelia intracellularis HH01]|uniref:Cytosol aminopeptidase PepA n=1 Tax=Richelia intracellularis HH01 TaxID=1165094 RepID=M1WZS5_9NOST|nr:Cytosol aminopeptidase PepA [Richelia intracellularis HH01]